MDITLPRDLFFFNVGETAKAWLQKEPDRTYVDRRWENCTKYNFMSAGYGKQYSSQLNKLKVGDIFAAFITKQGYQRGGRYANKHGYCGIGKVLQKACPINEFKIIHDNPDYNGRSLMEVDLEETNLLLWNNDPNLCEHVVAVKWLGTDPTGFWERCTPKLFSTLQIVCSMENQTNTIEFIKDKLGDCF